jgi:hypothetical protein
MSWTAAVDRGDLDEVLRWVGRLADEAAWDELDALRRRCRLAHERGHQLWPAASHAAHRLALDGPAALAVAVATTDGAAFGLGPLWEVVASRRTWAEVAHHAEPGPVASLMAQERVLRGDTIVNGPDLGEVEIPLRLAAAEPDYLLADYGPDEIVVDGPPPPDLGPPHRLRGAGRPVAGAAATAVSDAWRLVVEPWCSQSEGTLRTVSVEGDFENAVAALAGDDLVQLAECDLSTALLWLQWAAASGGAHGRRRGGAVGRALAWWLVATVAGVTDEWPIDGDELGRWGGELRWWLWSAAAGPSSGWLLRLAVADPELGVSWAVDALDAGERRPTPRGTRDT